MKREIDFERVKYLQVPCMNDGGGTREGVTCDMCHLLHSIKDYISFHYILTITLTVIHWSMYDTHQSMTQM